ncbi:hypothetical protein IJ556_00085 [bacterium]|nr:hypothetical protein [bacterium]
MYIIRDNNVVGGDKVVTPFGELTFKRTFETDDSEIAAYFRNNTGFTVTEAVENDVENDAQ